MKLTKTQYEKLKELMPIARAGTDIRLKIYVCNLYIIENGRKWRVLPKKYGNWHTVYMKFSRCPKNGTIAKAIAFFFETLF